MNSIQPPRKSLLAPAMATHTGANREGLHSTYRRLCEKNQLTVNDVYSGLMFPHFGTRGDRLACMSNAAYLFDKGCAASDRLAQRIRELTTLNDLMHLTLRELAGLRGVGTLVVSHIRKWCSECYEADLESELGPYDRLLWSIDAVKACPDHSVQLQTLCATCGEGPFPMLTGRDISGRCPKCLAWLGGRSIVLDENRDEHSRFLLWTAKSFADLLNAPLPFQQDLSGSIIDSLKNLSAAHYSGVYAHFAKAIERNKSVVASWLSRGAAPSWQALCEISFVFHVPISEILSGQTDAIAFSKIRRLPLTVAKRLTQPRKRPEKRDVVEIEALLTSVENGENPSLTSVGAIADRLGIQHRDLYRLVPASAIRVSKLLAKRRAVMREINKAAREQALRNGIQVIVSKLINSRVKPTRRTVDKELAIAGLVVGRNEAPLVKKLVQAAIITKTRIPAIFD